ncbi:MAG TPA: hypothetical protein VGI74_08035, partial [Streptosporangiaceae bacterium]
SAVGLLSAAPSSVAASTQALSWTQQIPAASPSARSNSTMAYDAATSTTVLFGGQGTATFGDTWTWDGTTWTQQHPAASPPSRVAPVLAYDTASGNAVLFGGNNTTGDLDDTWTWG